MWADVGLALPVDRLFTYRVPDALKGQIQAGQFVWVPFHRRSLRGLVVRLTEEPPAIASAGAVKEIGRVLTQPVPIPEHLIALARWMGERTGCSWGEALQVFAPQAKPSRNRSLNQTVQGPARAAEIPTLSASVPESPAPVNLTPDQEKALSAVYKALDARAFKAFLLHGITSSGKTEVYLRAVDRALQSSRKVIFLVPEISLCAPFLEQLRARFGDRVGLWHSQLTLLERNRMLERIREGNLDIVLGARSALFCPLEPLGLIVMDEEHDSAYKQEEKPRYHAREASLELARNQDAVLLMGGATPSVETYHRALEGQYDLLTLPTRVPGHSLPPISIVDRRLPPGGARKRASRFSPFARPLEEAITVSLARREQVILALNRRGFSTFVLCTSCGTVRQCRNCELALVHHREGPSVQEEYLLCHACFEKQPMPESCGHCGAKSLLLGGFGTQKVVQELSRIFPAARALRLDRDVAQKREVYAQTYRAFRGENADILVGTQMATQGFDFPRVTLVGIVDADTALHHPDFRAAERTFQWVCQAAGRAGRSPLGGRVLVQTTVPDHYVLLAAQSQDYPAFFRQEIEFRKKHRYPPFSELVLFRLRGNVKPDRISRDAERLAEALGSAEGVELLGPAPAPRGRIKKQLRWQILAKCSGPKQVRSLLERSHDFLPSVGIRLAVDVDPADLL